MRTRMKMRIKMMAKIRIEVKNWKESVKERIQRMYVKKFDNNEDVCKFCGNRFEEKTSLEKHTSGMHRPTGQSCMVSFKLSSL